MRKIPLNLVSPRNLLFHPSNRASLSSPRRLSVTPLTHHPSTCSREQIPLPAHSRGLNHLVQSGGHVTCGASHVINSCRKLSNKRPSQSLYNDQERLFKHPSFFDTPVLMLHCQWTDFAVSLHEPHKYVLSSNYCNLSSVINISICNVGFKMACKSAIFLNLRGLIKKHII